MGDHSLRESRNRLAMEGEELVLYRFSDGAIGMASSADLMPAEQPGPLNTFWGRVKRFFAVAANQPVTAVALPAGAFLILKDIPGSVQQRWGIGQQEGAVFSQSASQTNSHGDAVRFYNGAEVRLQDLREGIRVEVLSYGGTAAETEEWHMAEPAAR